MYLGKNIPVRGEGARETLRRVHDRFVIKIEGELGGSWRVQREETKIVEDRSDGREEAVSFGTVRLHGESSGPARIREQRRSGSSMAEGAAVSAMLVYVTTVGNDGEGTEWGSQTVEEGAKG